MNIDTHGKTNAQLVSIIDVLETERDHYKRELGLARDNDVLSAFHRRWHLTGKEAVLLAALYARRGNMVNKEGLMSAIYGDRPEEPEMNIVDVFVCKIRKKLRAIGAGPIDTVWGIGYAISPAGVEACAEAIRLAQC